MIRVVLFVIMLGLIAGSANAQLMSTGIGPGGVGGAAGVACGSGTIDLSNGCAFAMFGVM